MSELRQHHLSDDLDPRQYIEHVTRTAMLLESLAGDAKATRDRAAEQGRTLDKIRDDLAALSREFAVFKAETASKLSMRGTIAAGIAAALAALAALIWYIVTS